MQNTKGHSTVRGASLGGIYGQQSNESEAGAALAERQEVRYSCDRGHCFSLALYARAPVPILWQCRVCGTDAITDSESAVELVNARRSTSRVKSHAEYLRERRTTQELEVLLAERLAQLGMSPIA